MATPRKDTNFWHVHCHSQFSTIDAMAKVDLIVEKQHALGQEHSVLTDHGTMGGFVQSYLACKARNMKPWAGFEGYLIDPERDDWEKPAKNSPVGRFHYGILARNEDGYKALVKFSSMTHTRPRFSRFPRNTLADLLELGKNHGDDLVLTTGCYFGLIQQMIVRGRKAEALGYLRMFKRVFPNLFVELQHHNICHEDQPDEAGVTPIDDDQMVLELADMAEKLDLPLIATQDSHYLDLKHKPAHTLMKQMVYASTEDGFPGDGFHIASAGWVAEHYPQHVWDRVEDGFDELVDLWDLHIGPLDKYTIHVPTVSDDPIGEITEQAEGFLADYLEAEGIDDEQPYWDRLDYEIEIVDALNMGAYHLVVADYVLRCLEHEVMVEARGSANGSLLCFCLGITQTDPVRWGGMFERYLSKDRTKPPDIDLDIEDAERQWLLDYIIPKYNAVQIGTYSQLGSVVDKDTGEEKGSVLQTWLQSKRRECEKDAREYLESKGRKMSELKSYAGGIFNRRYGDIRGIDDVRRFYPKDYKGLRTLIEMNSVYKSYGTHAGGVLLSGDDVKIEDYIPTMLIASSDTTVTQYMGDDVEAFGLLKMDILGQSSLRVMKRCQQNIIEKFGESEFQGESAIDFNWIPLDDPAACKLLREGRMDTGIFHYEGYTKAKGGRELKIKSTEDAIMGQALFMPGAMDTGQKDLYIKRRNSAAERKSITYISKEFEKALNYTYGAVIYQEQVIEIMRNLGMDMAGINKFFKVVKDSGKGAVERNRGRMAEVREQFEELCLKRGITDVDAAWAQTAGFVSYGFNRAHASGYGIRSYRTAYLKAYFATEYMAALLEVWAGRTKEPRYIKEARRVGIKLLPPDVNVSGSVWSEDFDKNNVVRKGLSSVPGIGAKTAEELERHRPYDSIEDLIERTGRAVTGGKAYLEQDGKWVGSLSALNDVGALDSIL